MKSKVTLLVFFCMHIYTANAITWEKIETNLPGYVESFCKAGDKIYITANGIVKSDDNGKTFSKINKLFKNGTIEDIADEGYRVENIVMTKSGSLIASIYDQPYIVSHDEGESWNFTNLEYKRNSEIKIFEVNDDLYLTRKYGINHMNEFYKSTNNGLSWKFEPLNIENPEFINNIVKSSTDESLLFFDYKLKQIIKYNLLLKKSEIIPINDNTFQFEVLGDSWLQITKSGSFIFESTDEGKTWDTLSNMQKVIMQSGVCQSWQNVSNFNFETGTDNNLIAYTFYVNTGTYESRRILLYSTDRGENWEVVDTEHDIIKSSSINIVENDIYIRSPVLLKLNKSTHHFDLVQHPLNIVSRYLETSDNQTYLTTLSSYYAFWEKKQSSKWECKEDVKKAWVISNEEYYSIDSYYLKYVSKGKETILDSVVLGIDGMQIQNDLFLARITFHSLKTKTILFKKSKAIHVFNDDYRSVYVANDSLFYAFKAVSEETYQLVVYNMKQNTETSLNKIVSPSHSALLNVYVENDKIVIVHGADIELSDDAGTTWKEVSVLAKNYFADPKIFGGKIYLSLSNMLFGYISPNHYTLLYRGASISDCDLDEQGRILLYTSNGTFRSKEPVGVEENTNIIADIDINIYPNPAIDQVNIESSEEITGIEIYNLSGELLQVQSSLTVDTTELLGGTYFIKMQIGGKSVYKQFIIER